MNMNTVSLAAEYYRSNAIRRWQGLYPKTVIHPSTKAPVVEPGASVGLLGYAQIV